MGGGGSSTTNPVIPSSLLSLLSGTVGNLLPNQNKAWAATYTDANGNPINQLQVENTQGRIQELREKMARQVDEDGKPIVGGGLSPEERAELTGLQTQVNSWKGGTPEFMQEQKYGDYFGNVQTPDTAYAALEQALGGQGVEGFASPSVYEGIAASSALQDPLAGRPSLQALGEKTPDLSTLANNPMVTNAMKTWSDVQLPTLQNQASLMGLGRSSSLLKGIGASKNAFMLPIMQQAAGYESEAIGRGQQGATTEAANALTAQQNQFGNLFNLSNADTQRKLAASQQLTSMAGTERDWAKEAGDFALQDQLRRQALGENLLFQPLGGTASMVGSKTVGGK